MIMKVMFILLLIIPYADAVEVGCKEHANCGTARPHCIIPDNSSNGICTNHTSCESLNREGVSSPKIPPAVATTCGPCKIGVPSGEDPLFCRNETEVLDYGKGPGSNNNVGSDDANSHTDWYMGIEIPVVLLGLGSISYILYRYRKELTRIPHCMIENIRRCFSMLWGQRKDLSDVSVPLNLLRSGNPSQDDGQNDGRMTVSSSLTHLPSTEPVPWIIRPPTRNGSQEADGSAHRCGEVTLMNDGHMNLGLINLRENTIKNRQCD